MFSIIIKVALVIFSHILENLVKIAFKNLVYLNVQFCPL